MWDVGCSFPLLHLKKAFMNQNKTHSVTHIQPHKPQHKAQRTSHKQRLLKRSPPPPQKTGGYTFKYQSFFQPCQSLVVTILAGHPNHSESSWYRAVWAKQRKLLLIRTCLVAHGLLCLFWSNYLFGLKLFYLSFLILPVPLLLMSCNIRSFFLSIHIVGHFE